MEVGSPEWIEASLAELDDLERQHGELETALETSTDPAELRQQTAAIEALDAKIKGLYAQLEAVAEDDDPDPDAAAEDDGQVDAPEVTIGDDELSAPHLGATFAAAAAPAAAVAAVAAAPVAEPVAEALAAPAADPFGSPAPAADPFGSPAPAAASGGAGGFDAPAPVGFDDDDLKPKGGGAKWAFLGIVLAGGLGVGGFFAWKNMEAGKAQTKEGPAEPVTVIKAVDVPDDTEAPATAPSGEATISPNATGGDDAEDSKKKKKKDEKKKPLKIGGGDAPLGGL